MAYLTNAQIIVYRMKAAQKNVSSTEAMFEKKASADSFDVFLSHSSKDKQKVDGVVEFLRSFGVNVYIDKNDKELPQRTSPQTGIRLKEMIRDCRKFVVLASPASKDSKWIPWELGIGDEKKTMASVALLPAGLENQHDEWPEREYMGLYPRIARLKFANYDEPQWVVYDQHKPSGILLSQWLKK